MLIRPPALLAILTTLSLLVRSASAQEVDNLREASIDTWMVIVVAVLLAGLIGVATFLSPKRANKD